MYHHRAYLLVLVQLGKSLECDVRIMSFLSLGGRIMLICVIFAKDGFT